jgi:hypothetical protein
VPDAARRAGARDACAATLAYAALTIAFTWPLVRGLARDVPGDFGDPLLNCWILAWDADHLLRAVRGDLAALGGYWNANIYYPQPLALAYSDHLTAQALQILPVFAVTKNAVLCYNLLLLSTFVLSGLGMFLFARELTANRAAAFVAGLAYAFAPYRVGSIPHLQVLSSAWMAFALFGYRRFFETRRTRPLAGASAAWLAQNLSCSYYLIFFSLVLAMYIAWELTTRRLWRDVPALGRLVTAAATVVLATTPFVVPYIRLRRAGFSPRPLEQVLHFSADVYGYLTADPNVRGWGGLLHAWPRAENALFPGVTIVVLATIAIVATCSRSVRLQADHAQGRSVRLQADRLIAWALAISCVVLVAMLFGWSVRLPFLRITSFDRAMVAVAALAVALLAASPRARAAARAWTSSPIGMLTLLALFAIVMSFGPQIRSRGRLVEDTNVYAAFYNVVPGFDGLRVPARFGMIVALLLAALAGYGAAILHRLEYGSRLLAAAGALIVAESIAIPFPLNGNSTEYRQSGLTPLPDFVATGAAAPGVYRFVAQLPAPAALVELPFGEVAFETRYMFYSTLHWRPLANGYSGGAPDSYGLLSESLKDFLRRPEPAWKALALSGATHVIVHEGGYADGRGSQVSNWLRTHGARELGVFDGDRVFAIR